MKTPVESLQDAIDDYASYIEDAYGNAEEVRSAWHAILRPLDAYVKIAGLAPGFYCRRIEFDPCPGERDADDQRTVVRLEFISHTIPDVVMHLSTEDTDAVPPPRHPDDDAARCRAARPRMGRAGTDRRDHAVHRPPQCQGGHADGLAPAEDPRPTDGTMLRAWLRKMGALRS